MSQVIAKSKQFKEEKKQEKQLVESLIENIDEEFQQVLPNLPRRYSNKELGKTTLKGPFLRRNSEGNREDKDWNNSSLEVYSTESSGKAQLSDSIYSNHPSEYLSVTYDENYEKLDDPSSTIDKSKEPVRGTVTNVDSVVEQYYNEFESNNLPETFEEFWNRLFFNEIFQEQYLDDVMSESVEKQKNDSTAVNSEQLLSFLFRALELVASQEIPFSNRVRTLESIKILVQKIRSVLSSENVEQLENFVEKVTAQLSEPLRTSVAEEKRNEFQIIGTDCVMDLSQKLDLRLFFLLFSVSRLLSLKNSLSPSTSSLIFLVGEWLTRMKVSCLHQARKGLSLVELFLPHVESAKCFIPEFLTYCFSIVSLYLKENSSFRDVTILYNFYVSESLQRMIRQTIEKSTGQEWNEVERPKMLFRSFECDGNISCNSISSDDLNDVFNTLCDLFITCCDVVVRFATVFQSFDGFHGLIFPLLQILREISEDHGIVPAIRAASKKFASKLEAVVHFMEERGLKPLQLYSKKPTLPVEYEPKLKTKTHQQESRHLKQQVRKEKKKTMKWLHLETTKQQQDRLVQKQNEDSYRAKRTHEALRFLQEQQQNWNKQEKKWKNNKS